MVVPESDAYMWESGELHLLASGTSSRHSYFYNASEDGDDAFILTADALVPEDNDDLADPYDVKVGGGLAGQFAVHPGCSGDACQHHQRPCQGPLHWDRRAEGRARRDPIRIASIVARKQ